MGRIREANSQPGSQMALGLLFKRFPERVHKYEFIQICGPFSDQEMDDYHIERSGIFPDENYLFAFPPPDTATMEEIMESVREFIKEIKRDFWLQKKGLKTCDGTHTR
jgi:hypothetical protein